jgi:hypothetical protein
MASGADRLERIVREGFFDAKSIGQTQRVCASSSNSSSVKSRLS